jgi:hypothetical protein
MIQKSVVPVYFAVEACNHAKNTCLVCCTDCGSQQSSVGDYVTSDCATGWKVRGPNIGRDKRFFSSANRPERSDFPGGRVAGA